MGRNALVLLVAATIAAAVLVTGESRADPKAGELNVELPASTRLFPAGDGDGAAIANAQCLMCHSIEMVLYQPQRTPAQWAETINKMRTTYGAPIPEGQVDVLARYLAARPH